MVASSRAPAVAVVAAAAAAAAIAYWLKIRQELSRKRNKRIGQGISKLARQIQELLETRKPRRIDGLQPEMYKLPPFIPKSTWTCLGDALRDCETLDVQEVPGERFITLRLDGSGFSKLTRRMTALGVFSGGYSAEFAEIMRECCQSLMTKFNAACGYTQSDEMTLVIPAASIVRGEQQCHSHSGRVLKICTLAASHVTSLFNYRIQELFAQKGLCMEASGLATFDCRMGSFATMEEALSLILWRAADCGVNGVTDAVHKSKIPGARKIEGKATGEKLQWLAQNGLLPLQAHQAYGSYFVRSLRPHEGVNPKTGEMVQTLRSSIQELPEANVLCLAENAIDDTLRFLDAAFCAEAFWTSQARVGAAAEAAISVLLRQNAVTMATRIAAGLVALEEEFDRAADAESEAESKALQSFYFRVARLRSAVAFLLARFALDAKETSEGLRLQHAMVSLDQSIKGYVEEGVDLGCPNLDRPKMGWKVPYSHWWVYCVRKVSNDFGLCSMNELQAKLLKRRSVVEECGANYESVPTLRKEEDALTQATTVSTAATPLKTCAAVFKRTPSPCGGDFQAAIERRRATVDGDGQTFESTPTTKTADVTSSASTPTGASPAGIKPSCGTVDFKKRIDQQRASVDGGAQTFESRPSEHCADAGMAVPNAGGSSGQVFESTPEKTTADCVSSIRSAMQLPELPELQLPASPVQEQEPGDQDQEAGDDEEEEAEEAEVSDGSPTNKEPKTTLTASNRRVLWLVGLAHPLQDEFESDPFAVAAPGCSPVTLRLRADGQRCHLELSGPEDASGSYEVKLFVGKGWRKKSFRMWQANESLSEAFDTARSDEPQLDPLRCHFAGMKRNPKHWQLNVAAEVIFKDKALMSLGSNYFTKTSATVSGEVASCLAIAFVLPPR
ncbi:unnamed protein product [Symbiodinium necroappetens]|uniref:tRNAHis guanylyltransferase catalytic domain-containing protein n=1 Tax=Symbiodinium necroappetens TaxID=1628268 RepID=A0A812VZ02_9DINO|nr:unnamed protein product [Symbiodinium necroappetens]